MLAPMTMSSSAARPRLHPQVLHPAVCRLPRSLPSSGAKYLASRSLRLGQQNPRCAPLKSRRAAIQPRVVTSEATTFTSETNRAANPLRIVFVSAEVGPWSKTGGLGDVVGGLPIALAQRGHNVLTIAPRYRIATLMTGSVFRSAVEPPAVQASSKHERKLAGMTSTLMLGTPA